MNFARNLLLVLACLLPGAALAQHGQVTPHERPLLPALCQQMCSASLKVCDKATAPDDPACVTRRVVCLQTCQPCLVGREECGKSGGDFSACLSEYGACSRTRTDAGVTNRPAIAFRGGDGSSREQAVVVSGAQDAAEGAYAEDVWGALKHPGWRKKSQEAQQVDGKRFDLVGFEGPDGARAQVWFDASAYPAKDAPAKN
jgi:hypothetical protein